MNNVMGLGESGGRVQITLIADNGSENTPSELVAHNHPFAMKRVHCQCGGGEKLVNHYTRMHARISLWCNT